MAFSAFTITEGVCSIDLSQTYLPTCPLLTFDLIILHLLSTSALALCLVVLSTALLPSYWLAHSNIEGVPSGKDDPESTDAFVMWDLALASPPSSPRLSPQNSLQPSQARTYGTTSPGIPILPESYPQPGSTPTEIPVKRDKFAAGRLWYYVPLLLCSIFACAACIISLLAGSNKYGKWNIRTEPSSADQSQSHDLPHYRLRCQLGICHCHVSPCCLIRKCAHA